MLNKLQNPKTLKVIKITTVVVGIAIGAIVVTSVLYKAGMIGNAEEVVEEVVTAASAA